MAVDPLATLIYGYRYASANGGDPAPQRGQANFIGFTVVDNPTTGCTDITSTSGSLGIGTAGQVLSTNDAATATEWRSYVATDIAANVATTGVIRVGYNGTTAIPIISTLDNTGTTYNVVGMAVGNNIAIGNTAQNLAITAFGFALATGNASLNYSGAFGINYGGGSTQALGGDQAGNIVVGYTTPTTNGDTTLFFTKSNLNPTTIANTGFGIFADATTGVAKLIDAQDNVGTVGTIALSLANDFVGTTSTSAQTTNLAYAVAATDIFDLEIEGNVSVSTGTSGYKIAIAAPTGAIIEGTAFGNTTAVTTVTTTELTSISTLFGTFGTVATTVTHIRIRARVKMDGTHAGTITFEGASVGGVAFTFKKGFTLKATRVIEV